MPVNLPPPPPSTPSIGPDDQPIRRRPPPLPPVVNGGHGYSLQSSALAPAVGNTLDAALKYYDANFKDVKGRKEQLESASTQKEIDGLKTQLHTDRKELSTYLDKFNQPRPEDKALAKRVDDAWMSVVKMAADYVSLEDKIKLAEQRVAAQPPPLPTTPPPALPGSSSSKPTTAADAKPQSLQRPAPGRAGKSVVGPAKKPQSNPDVRAKPRPGQL